MSLKSASPLLSNLRVECANTVHGGRSLCRVSLSDQLQVQEFVDGLRSHFRAGWYQCLTHFVEQDAETKVIKAQEAYNDALGENQLQQVNVWPNSTDATRHDSAIIEVLHGEEEIPF